VFYNRLKAISHKWAEFIGQKAASPSIAHFLLVGFGFAVAEAVREHAWTNRQFGPLLGIAFTLLITLYLIIRINQHLDRMEPQIGVKTKLMNAEQTYKEAERVIRNAKEEILAITNWAQPFQSNTETLPDMKSYFPALLQKITDQDVRYERIVQMPPMDKRVIQHTQPMIDHIRDCIAKRKDKEVKGTIAIFRCDELIAVNFLLVDCTHLFFQIDEFDENAKCFQFSKCLVVTDHQREMTTVFKRLFESIKSRGFRSLEKEDVDAISPA
jgi:hypothetical protein